MVTWTHHARIRCPDVHALPPLYQAQQGLAHADAVQNIQRPLLRPLSQHSQQGGAFAGQSYMTYSHCPAHC